MQKKAIAFRSSTLKTLAMLAVIIASLAARAADTNNAARDQTTDTDKPVLLLPATTTYTFATTLAKNESRAIRIKEHIRAIGATQAGILGITIPNDKETIQITGEKAGTTTLIIQTEEADAIVIVCEVTTNKKAAKAAQQRFLQISKIMDQAAQPARAPLPNGPY